MDANSAEANAYLSQLYKMTSGKVDNKVSMFDVGAAMGLEKNDAGKIAENLIGSGLVEVKTLSGGIGITQMGIDNVEAAGGGNSTSTPLAFGDSLVLAGEQRESVEMILKDIQDHISGSKRDYDDLSEMIIDIKTIEVQLLSPKPKTAIVREVMRSLHSALQSAGNTDLIQTIGKAL